jgi:DNA-binding protein Fis
MDPLKLPLEELLYVRLGRFFDQLNGRAVPDLYRVLLEQVDRALLRQALERSDGQLGAAARFLGVDRNTFARKARRLKVDGACGGDAMTVKVKSGSRPRSEAGKSKVES